MSRRLTIRVVPRASKNEIKPLPDGSLKIKLTAPPVDGAANEALIKFLAKEFKVAKSLVRIVAGKKGKNKIVEILN